MNMSRTIAGAVGRQGPVEAVVVIRAGNLSACLVCSGQYGVPGAERQMCLPQTARSVLPEARPPRLQYEGKEHWSRAQFPANAHANVLKT
jgi:hypothetical protein